MSNATTIGSIAEAGEDAAEIQSTIHQMFARMDEIDVQIARDQAESDSLRAETQTMIEELTAFSTRSFNKRTE